jgi:hypothetical protein
VLGCGVRRGVGVDRVGVVAGLAYMECCWKLCWAVECGTAHDAGASLSAGSPGPVSRVALGVELIEALQALQH